MLSWELFLFDIKKEKLCYVHLKHKGLRQRPILTLATVGIISAFLVGSPQHASADQTYVSDPNQLWHFPNLKQLQIQISSLKQVYLVKHLLLWLLCHIPLWMVFIHMKMTMNKRPQILRLLRNWNKIVKQLAVLSTARLVSKTYETRIPTNTDSNHKAVENHSEPKTETVAQAQTWSKDGATWVSTEINNGNVHKILSTYIPKPLTPSTKPTTTATLKPKQSTPAVSQPKKSGHSR